MKNFYRLIQGDCIKVLKGLDENSIDCAVTDPPYGIAFMGKSWDKALPPKEAFAEMFRVLKPGALAFVMSSPRQDVLWRMMAMLEGVGFELRQSPIYWTYASGFPKAYDVSFGIDRKIIREEFIKDYGRKPTKEELKELMKKKRKIIDKRKKLDSFSTQAQVYRPNAQQSEKAKKRMDFFKIELNITEPYSPLAKRWVGWKSQTGLKPAVEVILMVNKPRSERTIVDNVLKHGTGAVNVDECRIPFNGNSWKPQRTHDIRNAGLMDRKGRHETRIDTPSQKGRFPANLLVSDDVLDTGKITKSSGGSGDKSGKLAKNIYGKYNLTHLGDHAGGLGDSGGFSRFFSLHAWWRERIKKLPKDIQKTFPFLVVPKASRSEREKGLEKYPLQMKKYRRPNEPERSAYGYNWNEERPDGSKRRPIQTRNIHPTVKPLRLMCYLVTLSCPPGGVVLDPFLGSGTTMLAAMLMNKSCVGVELNREYCEIAKDRCFNRNLLTTYTFEYNFEIFK